MMFFLVWTVLAQAFEIQKSSVNFVAVGKPAMIKIRGEGDCMTGTFKVSGKELLVTADCEMVKLTTGIELRDKHMREKFLEVGRFPKGHFEGSVPFKDGTEPFQGRLTLRDKTVPVAGEVVIDGAHLEFTWKVKVSDFEIPIPEYLGVKVADSVTVSVVVDGKLSAEGK